MEKPKLDTKYLIFQPVFSYSWPICHGLGEGFIKGRVFPIALKVRELGRMKRMGIGHHITGQRSSINNKGTGARICIRHVRINGRKSMAGS